MYTLLKCGHLASISARIVQGCMFLKLIYSCSKLLVTFRGLKSRGLTGARGTTGLWGCLVVLRFPCS